MKAVMRGSEGGEGNQFMVIAFKCMTFLLRFNENTLFMRRRTT